MTQSIMRVAAAGLVLCLVAPVSARADSSLGPPFDAVDSFEHCDDRLPLQTSSCETAATADAISGHLATRASRISNLGGRLPSADEARAFALVVSSFKAPGEGDVTITASVHVSRARASVPSSRRRRPWAFADVFVIASQRECSLECGPSYAGANVVDAADGPVEREDDDLTITLVLRPIQPGEIGVVVQLYAGSGLDFARGESYVEADLTVGDVSVAFG